MNRRRRLRCQSAALTAAATALLLAPTASLAQYYGGGGADSFALQRWEEDYSHLKDPTARTNWYDAIKYVPLGGPDSDAYLSFGGQARYRYDYFNNYTFGPGVNDEDGFHLQRYLVHADAHLHPNVRAFVQLNAAYVSDRAGGPRYGDVDDIDLQQAFVDFKTTDDTNPWGYVRLGRQELWHGAGRYVTPDDWRNVRRAFDGVKVALSVPNNSTEVFVTRPVVIEQNEFNEGDSSTTFAGIYNVTALPTVLGPEAGTKLDTYLYYLSQREDSSPPQIGVPGDTYTVGARLHARPGPFDFDLEGNYQFGNVDGSRLSAWSVAGVAGYTFESAALTPRVYAGFDAASGSADPSGRFNQLFPPTYDFLGHLYLFGRPNLIDVHAGVNLHLTEDLMLGFTHWVYWRQNTDDALFNLAGGVVRADNGTDAAYVGNEFDVYLTYRFNKHLDGYIGYAHFFAGDYIQETGPSKDVDFLYASATLTF